ncbi:hypothetical protein [Trichothermofontia sp.]
MFDQYLRRSSQLSGLTHPLDTPTPNLLLGDMPCPVIDQRLVINCHIRLPDTPKAVSAVCYNGDYYSYVRLYPNAEAAKRGVDRLLGLGNTVILTQVRKGLVLWVLEPDARLAHK